MNRLLKTKHILLINPAKQDKFKVSRIHMGLTLMGQILVANNYRVKIMDYAFLKDLKDKIKVPDIKEVIEEFKPDVIGISVFTYLYNECRDLIERVSQCSNAPIILGGPHFSMFPEDFSRDKRISYIIRGEAEKVILNLVATAKHQELPVLINSPLPSAEEIPSVNLDIAFGHEYLSVYQIQLSRGCPYRCSFCNVRFIAGGRVRMRNLELCLNQIIEVKRRHPNIKVITITDDFPMADKERFKQFLLMFKQANIGCKLMIDNVRANLIDEEIVKLYAEAGGQHICLGVESGHPEVFKLVNKGESLEDIRRAAEIVRKNNLALGLCFVIGLPGDNLKRHLYSVKFAKSLKPDYIFWNMCVPWPRTEVQQWYQSHGEIGELRNFSTLIDPGLNFEIPVCSSPDFSKEEMIKAWLVANMETNNFLIYNLTDLKKLFLFTYKYNLYRSLAIYFMGFIPKAIRVLKGKIKRHYLLRKNMRDNKEDKILIQEITFSDYELLKNFFERNNNKETTRHFHPFPLTAKTARFIALKPHKDYYYLAFLKNKVVGFSMLRGWDEGFAVPSFGIVIDRDFRGKDIGKAMLQSIISKAMEFGCKSIRLTVYASNIKAQRLFASFGFKELDRNLIEISGEKDEKIIMIKKLQQ